MTPDQALSCLTELKALERLHAVIAARPAPAFEWRCALTALDDRLRWVRYCLSQEDPQLVAAVQDRYDSERRNATIVPDKLTDDSLSEVGAAPEYTGPPYTPPSTRIH